jgi:hypothetical protein
MTVGPLLKALGVLVVIMVFLMAVMLAGTSAVAPTQSLMPGSLIVAEK